MICVWKLLKWLIWRVTWLINFGSVRVIKMDSLKMGELVNCGG